MNTSKINKIMMMIVFLLICMINDLHASSNADKLGVGNCAGGGFRRHWWRAYCAPDGDDGDGYRNDGSLHTASLPSLHQAAKASLALGEYLQRLRVLSSIWSARPRDPTKLIP
ncbi:hypothetical protein L1987_00426 [Smallanthus sonchifolius]|uniref:Uncharacterized protein n=1 Tax=Smallanthus sonchifolius TaxID=185202 RepID=A0ACB9K273_9ASTR|nr:hypothetical protein L1987_00426 [Smallanthus sonchifolius]